MRRNELKPSNDENGGQSWEKLKQYIVPKNKAIIMEASEHAIVDSIQPWSRGLVGFYYIWYT